MKPNLLKGILRFYFPIGIVFFGCNSERIDQLEKALQEKSDSIRIQNEKIVSLENQIFSEQNNVRVPPEEVMIKIFKEDREFKTPKGQRKNFEVRKIDQNIYYIRYDYRHPDYISYRDWSTSIYQIEFLPNSKYQLKWIKGNDHQ